MGKGPGTTSGGPLRRNPPEGVARVTSAYSSRLINRRSLPLFFDTTVATVVKPFLR